MEKIAFCLEDDEEMPISHALKSSYNGDNIYFSKGNNHLAEKMYECLKCKYSFVIGFIDIPPGNKDVVTEFRKSVKYFRENNIMDKVLLLPVICTEFYVLLVLDKLGCLKLGRNYVNAWKVIKQRKKYNLGGKSLEEVCKDILGASVRECQRNTNKGSYGGSFYRIDCTSCYKKNCFTYLKGFKAEWVYSGLPCFDVVSPEHRDLMLSYGIKLSDKSKREIIDEIKLDYLNLYAEYGIKAPIL